MPTRRWRGLCRRSVCERRWQRATRAIVVTRASRTERDVVPVLEILLANDPFAVDVRPVQAAEITQRKAVDAPLQNAVLLRHDLVEKLNGVAWMAPE